MAARRYLRIFAITVGGQLLTTLITAAMRRGDNRRLLLATLLWILIFALFNSLLTYLLHKRYMARRARMNRVILVLVSLGWALLFYSFTAVFTGGYIANIKFPLLLIFIAGSVPSFVDTLWTGSGNTPAWQALLSWVLVMALGLLPALAVFVTARNHQTRLIIVRNVPGPDLRPKVESTPHIPDINPHERQRLEEIGLTGKVLVTVVMDLGPEKPPVSELIIVLQSPVKGDIELHEPKEEVIYLQQGSTWKTLPPDSVLDWRTVDLSPANNATDIEVWQRLGVRFGFEAVDWKDATHTAEETDRKK